MDPVSKMIEMPRFALGLLSWGMLACAPSAGLADSTAAPPDTSHCGPQVVVLHAKSREPVASAYVHVRQQGEWTSTFDHDRSMEVDDRGRVDFAALPVGDYEVAVIGISRRRPLADWKPPPGEREIGVGFDPWRRPDQIQRFRIHREWRVTRGNCWDSLVVLVRPTKWELERWREPVRREGLFPKRR